MHNQTTACTCLKRCCALQLPVSPGQQIVCRMRHVIELSKWIGVLIGSRVYYRLRYLTKTKKTERLYSCVGG